MNRGKFKKIAKKCPWNMVLKHKKYKCTASFKECKEKNCAILHWIGKL